MTPAEKKRLIWILIAIFFFFANLILAVILVWNQFGTKEKSPQAATTQQVATQP